MKTRSIALFVVMIAMLLVTTQCAPAASTITSPTNPAPTVSIPTNPPPTDPPPTDPPPTDPVPTKPSPTEAPPTAPAPTDPAPTSTAPANSASPDGKALVQERCTECHTLQRIQNARKSAAEWKATVERMVGKGARLSLDEIKIVIEYLAATYPE